MSIFKAAFDSYLLPNTRIGRSTYAVATLVIPMIVGVNAIFLDSIFIIIFNFNLFQPISIIVMSGLCINSGIKRCHDLGWSGWHLLWSIVPIANIFLGFYLYFFSGSSVKNKYDESLGHTGTKASNIILLFAVFLGLIGLIIKLNLI